MKSCLVRVSKHDKQYGLTRGSKGKESCEKVAGKHRIVFSFGRIGYDGLDIAFGRG